MFNPIFPLKGLFYAAVAGGFRGGPKFNVLLIIYQICYVGFDIKTVGS